MRWMEGPPASYTCSLPGGFKITFSESENHRKGERDMIGKSNQTKVEGT